MREKQNKFGRGAVLRMALFTRLMCLRTAILLVMMMGGIGAKAYVVGNYIKMPYGKGYITYRVIDASASSPKLAVYNVRGVEGTVEIPAKVFDGKDVYFTVTQIGGAYDSNDPTVWDEKVTEVKLPNTITTLANYCFHRSHITSLTLPASVKEIEPRANVLLGSCPKLKEIKVESGNPAFISDGGVLYTKGHKKLICIPCGMDFSATGGKYEINANTKSIAIYAIGTASTLKKLIIPASVEYIYMGSWPTFSFHPESLKEIEVDGSNPKYCSVDGVLYNKDKSELIYYPSGKEGATFKVPDGVKSIPYGYTFYCAYRLTSIDFNQVEKLGDYCMASCHNISEITIPSSLTSIGRAAFASMKGLTKYIVQPGNPNYSSDKDGVLFNKDKTKLIAYPTGRVEKEYKIPSSVTEIGTQAFMDAKIEKMTIPAGITSLGVEAFRAILLETVVFEEPSKITELRGRTFLWCPRLTTATLPKSLKTLGTAFAGCDKLKTVNVPDGSQLETIKKGAFVACRSLTNFNFQGSCKLKTIESSAFADLENLKSFDFPASVTTIGDNAFGNTPAMGTVNFADNSTIISFGEGAFSNSGIKRLNIPASVTSIEKEAFKNCNVLERVNVPAGCTNIHPEAFKYDSKLANIDVDAANPKYSSVQGILLSKDKSELLIFPPGKARTDFTLLPPSITKIGNYAFYEGGSQFTNIVIPAKVNAIGIRAFGLNPALKTVTLLCDELIPGSRIDQGENTMSFDNGKVAADDAKSHITVYVRKSLLDKYKSDPFWKNFTLKPSFTVKAEGTSAATDEYIPTSPTTVDFLSTTADVKTFVLPEQVKTDEGGTSKTYKVGLIGDYAFENANEHMKEVVVKAAVDYIGAMAFVTKTKRVAANGQSTISPVSTTIRQVIFTGNAPARKLSQKYFSLGAAFSEFFRGASGTGNCEQKIYVKKSKLSDYKAAWSNYAKALDYKIQGDGNAAFKINRKYGTFAREFDTDFSDYLTQKHAVKVAAFVAGTPILRGSGDYGKSSYHVRMTSVDLKGGVNGNYGYIPAGTGVLLKVLDKESTPADFYYTIGEHDNVSYSITENVMKGVTVNDAAVNASPGSPVYVMQDGMFRKAETPVNGFTVHKAYAKLGSLPAGAKVTFVFDDGEATGIENVDAAEDSERQDVWYNLNGQRVSRPEHGIYIRNGKKVIIK